MIRAAIERGADQAGRQASNGLPVDYALLTSGFLTRTRAAPAGRARRGSPGGGSGEARRAVRGRRREGPSGPRVAAEHLAELEICNIWAPRRGAEPGRLGILGPGDRGPRSRAPRWLPEIRKPQAALMALSRRRGGAAGSRRRPRPASRVVLLWLLARIHRYTLNRLRAEIEPVTPADFMRFLFAWQRIDPDQRVLAGRDWLRSSPSWMASRCPRPRGRATCSPPG